MLGLLSVNSACKNSAEFSFWQRPKDAETPIQTLDQASDVVSPPRLGKKVPDFQLLDSQGKSHKLSDFRGNIVLLNFWATWCPPCIEEFPSMEELNRRLKSKDFTMLAVSVDDSWEEINLFMKRLKNPPSFLILHDQTKNVVTKDYGTVKFPETFLIGRDGSLLKHYEGAINWVKGEEFEEILRFLQKTE